MANIKASELELDTLIEGNEKLVSTDGDGKTRNIKSEDLANYAVNKVNPSIQANTQNIVNLDAKVTSLTDKDAELEQKQTDLETKVAQLTTSSTGAAESLSAEIAQIKKQHEDDMTALMSAHNAWEEFGI